jgi:hypothetical protein
MENKHRYIFQSSTKWQSEEKGNEGKKNTKLRQIDLKVKFFLTD